MAAWSAATVAGCFELCSVDLLSVLPSRHQGLSLLKVSSLENLLWQQVTWLQSWGGGVCPENQFLLVPKNILMATSHKKER